MKAKRLRLGDIENAAQWSTCRRDVLIRCGVNDWNCMAEYPRCHTSINDRTRKIRPGYGIPTCEMQHSALDA